MKNLKDIILEKLKVSKNTDTLSFTFGELCDSIVRFVNKNLSNRAVKKFGLEYVVNIFELDYFKDNPLIIQDETPIHSIIKPLQGCKIGTMSANTKTPNHIECYTTGRNITLNNKFVTDVSFDITEKNFSQIFDTIDLETLYEILNEGI